MKETIEITKIFNSSPTSIYHAWLDSDLHGKMTGGEAICGKQVGDDYSAWDGYIVGKNIELIENFKIVQTWRTSQFSEADEDSILTITLKGTSIGTELVLSHTNIPEGQTQYEQGWIDHYFTPMGAFFGE